MLLKKLVNTRGYSPIMVNGVSMLCGGIAALITSIHHEGIPMIKGTGEWVGGFFVSNIMMFMFYLMAAIVIANIIFYNLYGYLLKQYSATFLSFAGFTTPLFAALYGRIFLAESVSASFFIAVGLVGTGLTLFYQDELKENR
jgi:drug/metabolite transporter (DMT)-like permease